MKKLLKYLKQITIILDMDNTIAQFSTGKNSVQDSIKRSYEKGFFRNLHPHKNLWVYKMLALMGVQIYVLSACINTPWCRIEKAEWLAEHLPWLNRKNIIFCECGQNKATVFETVVGKQIDKNHCLVDDYGINLMAWKNAGGTPVKKSSSKKSRPIAVVHNHLEIFPVIASIASTSQL